MCNKLKQYDTVAIGIANFILKYMKKFIYLFLPS